jgi:DNA-directed RNA polymerase specialized sigma24 family protein
MASGQVRAVPESFDDFYRQYDEYIESAIRKISRGYVRPDDLEDLRQQIYFRIVESDYLNRSRRLIQERGEGSFTTYLFALIRSVLSNRFDKNTRNPLNMAIGVIESAPEDGLETAALVLETYSEFVEEDFGRAFENKDYLDRFENYVSSVSEPWGPPIQFEDGSSHRKSLLLVFQLMRKNWEPPEIAKALHVTPGSVFGYIKKIKGLAAQFSTR